MGVSEWDQEPQIQTQKHKIKHKQLIMNLLIVNKH
jgi:hypothetical protein